jgi:hypothetical protein
VSRFVHNRRSHDPESLHPEAPEFLHPELERAPVDPATHRGTTWSSGTRLAAIGAYEPRWFIYRMHMNPDEAVRAHLDLHSQSSVGIHFGLIDNAGDTAPQRRWNFSST